MRRGGEDGLGVRPAPLVSSDADERRLPGRFRGERNEESHWPNPLLDVRDEPEPSRHLDGPPPEVDTGPAGESIEPVSGVAESLGGTDVEIVQSHSGNVLINAGVGQTLRALGPDFAVGVHYIELFEYEHERRQAENLGMRYDVRGLEAAHDRTDGLGNPDVIVRTDSADQGSYADLKRLDPDEPPTKKDPDYSRRVEKRLRDPFSQDSRITVAVVDGRDVGLTIDAAVRGIRRALGFWRQQGREVTPDQRMIVFTADGTAITWRGDTGAIDVST